jgi:hypothetical protein
LDQVSNVPIDIIGNPFTGLPSTRARFGQHLRQHLFDSSIAAVMLQCEEANGV